MKMKKRVQTREEQYHIGSLEERKIRRTRDLLLLRPLEVEAEVEVWAVVEAVVWVVAVEAVVQAVAAEVQAVAVEVAAVAERTQEHFPACHEDNNDDLLAIHSVFLLADNKHRILYQQYSNLQKSNFQ